VKHGTLRGAAISLLAGLAALGPSSAEQSRVASVAAAGLREGEASGVAVTSRGRLELAPTLARVSRPLASGDPALVFAVASDGGGRILLATGPDGQVVRVTSTGDSSVVFRATEPLVTALLPLPGGDLLAATAPGGKIYRITPDGKGRVWCETEERYVWALARLRDETVLAATGERGRLLAVDRTGKSRVLFDANETHLVSLAVGADGSTWAGGSGRGLVYRIDAAGHGVVVYDDELPEAKAIAPGPGGEIIVAFDAAPAPDKRPPALRIRVGGAGEGVGDLEGQSGTAIQGVIEGLGATTLDEGERLRGKLVRIAADGTDVELWRSQDEAPFAAALDGDGHPIFATGEPARLWRVESPHEVSLLATLKEAQATAIAREAKGLVVATSNPAGVYRLDAEPGDAGTYTAPPLDAGGIARWGSLTWRAEGGGRVEIATRTGNSADPDGTWSPWKGSLANPVGSAVPSPEGRFLQWRARLVGGQGTPRIAGVGASYVTRNRPPNIRDLRVDPASGAVSAKATLRWSVADADGDPVAVDVEVRKTGETAWTSASRAEPTAPKSGESSSGSDGFYKDGRTTWDTVTWDEGTYEVRALTLDAGANPPGEGLSAVTDLPIALRVDRTPPDLRPKRVSGGGLDVEVTDAVSGVARLEIIEAGRVVASPRPTDGVADGSKETFRVPADTPGQAAPRTLRATDGAGNTAEAEVPAP
jgi:hypothetical protein